MSSMYEYDPELKQYRKKRVGETAEPEAPAASASAGLTSDPLADASAAAPPQLDRYKPPPRPGGLTVGKVLFWLVFAGLFGGWAYFMYNVLMEDYRKERDALKAVTEDNGEFNKLLEQPAVISVDDVVVEGNERIDFEVEDSVTEPTEPAPEEPALDTSFLEPDGPVDPDIPAVQPGTDVELRSAPGLAPPAQ